MASQLIYTSAAKLLDAGRSGFGTVARARTITPLVVSAIERVSQFANLRGLDRSRVIHVHRRITAGSNRFHILTRIVDAGADYTGRTNHLAHHLVVSQEEAARAAARGVTPADILRQFPWLDRWDGNARFLEAAEDVPLESFHAAGLASQGQAWAAVTGNANHSRLLSFDAAPRNGVLLVPGAADPLALMAEALAGFGAQSWSRTFTTSLETTDELSDLEWIVTTPAAFVEIQSRCASRTLFDLGNPGSLPTPPAPAVAAAPAPAQFAMPNVAAVGPQAAAPAGTANPVQVRVVENGSRSTASARRASPKDDRKTQIKLLAGVAALLLCMGILGWAAMKTISGPPSKADEKAQASPSEPRLSDEQEQLRRNLEGNGIEKNQANLLIEKAAGNSKKWALYVIDTNNKLSDFGESSQLDDLKELPEPPFDNEPPGGPNWIIPLIEGTKDLKLLANLGEGDITKESFVTLALAIENLNLVLNEGHTDKYRQEKASDRELFFSHIGKTLLEEIIKLEKFDDLEAILKLPDIWENSPERHQMLEAIIDDTFTKGKHPQINFKELFGMLGRIQKFDNQLHIKQAHAEAVDTLATVESNNPEIPETSPMAGVPDKEIILASKEDLKNGVAVKMLKAIINKLPTTSKPEKTDLFSDLKLSLNSSDEFETTENLTISDELLDSYYCSIWNDSNAPRFHTNGKFSIAKQDVVSLDFSYGEKRALIVLDQKSQKAAMKESLGFKIEIKDDNIAIIKGDLADWMNAFDKEPKLHVLDDSKRLIFVKSGDKYVLRRKKQATPFLVLSKESATQIKGAMEAYNKVTTTSLPEKERAVAQMKKDALLIELRICIEKAIGGGVLSKELGLRNESFITATHWDKSKEIMNSYTERSSEHEKFDDDIREIKSKIGENQFEPILKRLGTGVEWRFFEDQNNGQDAKRKKIEELLKNAEEPENSQPFDDELKELKNLTVTTQSGRVLFTGTREN